MTCVSCHKETEHLCAAAFKCSECCDNECGCEFQGLASRSDWENEIERRGVRQMENAFTSYWEGR